MPLFTVDDARKLWESILNDPEWPSGMAPDFLYCGSFDYKLQAFPVMSLTLGHYVWIPVEWKFAFRFLNHVIYCLWHASRDQRFPDGVRKFQSCTTKYAERLRSGFLEEVVEYWYPPSSPLPNVERPTRRDQPLHSHYLTSFLEHMFNCGSPAPNVPCAFPEWKSDPTTFDWDEWARTASAPHKVLYGVLPPVDTEEYERLSEESKAARVPIAPSVEIDSFSWTSYASEAFVRYSSRRSRAAHSIVSSQRPRSTAQTSARERPASPERKTKRKRSSMI